MFLVFVEFKRKLSHSQQKIWPAVTVSKVRKDIRFWSASSVSIHICTMSTTLHSQIGTRIHFRGLSPSNDEKYLIYISRVENYWKKVQRVCVVASPNKTLEKASNKEIRAYLNVSFNANAFNDWRLLIHNTTKKITRIPAIICKEM